MKLQDCIFGKLVITQDLEIGHIVGLTYTMHLMFAGSLSNMELMDRTIPLVKFPKGERGVHHESLEAYK